MRKNRHSKEIKEDKKQTVRRLLATIITLAIIYGWWTVSEEETKERLFYKVKNAAIFAMNEAEIELRGGR